ncbi:MAG TPA: copper-binding protein [Casimicrobiaceae bacterium]|nr:copper-binding protein [Casimicrobiaceae bacterium]
MISLLAALAIGANLAPISFAIAAGELHSVSSPMVIAAADTVMSEGEIRKVDKDAKKITIRHGELKNLNMPPMTMVFQVNDPAMLDKVKAGDRVKFRADNVSGAFTVMEIETMK